MSLKGTSSIIKQRSYSAEPWEEPVKKRSRFLPVLCAILALCVVFLACVCLYYVKVNGALAQENINLSRALHEATQTSSSGPSSFLEEKAREQAERIDELYGPGAYGGTDWTFSGDEN